MPARSLYHVRHVRALSQADVEEIAVEAINDLPLTYDGSYVSLEDGPPIIITLRASDVDSAPVELLLSRLPTRGTVYLPASAPLPDADAISPQHELGTPISRVYNIFSSAGEPITQYARCLPPRAKRFWITP